MTRFTVIASLVLSLMLVGVVPAIADDSDLKDATRQVENGAKSVGQGIEDTAKGVGNTVVEGAKKAGDRLDEAGKAAEPKAKSAWEHVRDGATAFGDSVKSFFVRLFND